MTAAGPVLSLRGVTKAFPLADGGALQVLDVEHLELPAAGRTAIKGRSGSGKTTLLTLIARVSAPTGRTIGVHGTPPTALPEPRRARARPPRRGGVLPPL